MKHSHSINASVARARRLIQLIERQVVGSRCRETIADLDDYDLVTYRLSELCHLSGLPKKLEEDLRTRWSGISVGLHSRRSTLSDAMGLIAAAKGVLKEIGADPNDHRLDERVHRFQRVQDAAIALFPQLQARGVAAAYVFGSVARDEDGPDSDVDIALEVSPDWDGFSALDLGWALMAFQEILETKVDVVELSSLSERMRERIEPDLRRLTSAKLGNR